MRSNNLSVLIIDDSEIIQDRLKEILCKIEGVDCIGMVRSSAEGLAMTSSHKPGLVVLDIKLSDRIGIDIVEKVKHLSPDSIVIVLTNYPFAAYRIRCMSVGADYFLDKSLEFSKVGDIAEYLLTMEYRNGSTTADIYTTRKDIIDTGNRNKVSAQSPHIVRKGI